MSGMSTNSSAQNRNRVPEGVPTGGQFAASRKSESGASTLAPAEQDMIAWYTKLQEIRSDEEPRPSHSLPPEVIADPLSEDRDRTRRRAEDARARSEAIHDLAAGTVHAGLAHQRHEEQRRARHSALHATVLHAAAHDEDYERIRDEVDTLPESDPAAARAAGLDEHPAHFTARVVKARRILDWASSHGIGQNAVEASREDLPTILPEGQQVERADFSATTPTRMTVSGHSDGGDTSYLVSDGSDPAQVGYTDEHWGGACLVRDDQGNLIALDEETGAPRVIYRLLDRA